MTCVFCSVFTCLPYVQSAIHDGLLANYGEKTFDSCLFINEETRLGHPPYTAKTDIPVKRGDVSHRQPDEGKALSIIVVPNPIFELI